MRRLLTLLPIALLVAIALVACGAGDDDPSFYESTATSGQSAAAMAMDDADFAESEEMAEEAMDEEAMPEPAAAMAESAGGGDGGDAALQVSERRVISTGFMSLEVDDVPAAAGQVRIAAEALGGFVESSTVSGDDEDAFAEVTIRVPQEAFPEALERPLPVVEMLAREDIPVMGHLGLVPRKSTWIGGLRAVGKTRAEALTLHRRFRQLEDAGAFGVEAELIPDRIMGAISARTGLVTFSLGSGPDADVMYLFMEDICGENDTRPRHARAFGDIASLHRAIRVERVDALKRFRECALGGGFPGPRETVSVPDHEYQSFVRALDAQAREGPA